MYLILQFRVGIFEKWAIHLKCSLFISVIRISLRRNIEHIFRILRRTLLELRSNYCIHCWFTFFFALRRYCSWSPVEPQPFFAALLHMCCWDTKERIPKLCGNVGPLYETSVLLLLFSSVSKLFLSQNLPGFETVPTDPINTGEFLVQIHSNHWFVCYEFLYFRNNTF